MLQYIIIILIILFIWGFFIEPNLLVVKHYKAEFLNGKKIVFISDLHIARKDTARLDRIIKQVNLQKPDLVLAGGDFVKGHAGENTLAIEDIAKRLAEINAPIVTVLGNHDGWYDKYRVQHALENNGIKVLRNSNVNIDGLCIAGVEDIRTGSPDVDVALENTTSPVILISHSPDIYFDVKKDVDLILAGHVHGGQVRVPLLGVLICPSRYGTKFCGGDYKETQNRMIVSRGLGTSILSVRFCDIPEIVVLEG